MTEKVLIPLDGSKAAETALRHFEQLVSKLEPNARPEVTLLQVVKPPVHHIPVEGGTVDITDTAPEMKPVLEQAAAYLEGAAAHLRKMGVTVRSKVANGEKDISSANRIIEAETETGADLVVMSTHGRRGLTRWAYGSVTDKVLRSGSVPVLLVRVTKESAQP